jgi:predicted ferric reductase
MRTKASFLKNAFFWLTIFFVLVVAPLGLALIGHQEESRSFWIEFGVGLGFVGLAMMGLQFLLTARYNKIGAPFGLDELLQFHGQAGYFAWAFIIAHFVILFLADSDFHEFLDPRVNLPRALALSSVIIAITALIALTHWREKIGLIYEWWRASHGLLALFVVFVGTVHIMQVGFYINELWQQVLWVSLSCITIGLLVHNRVWRPWQMSKKPYKVTSVKKETDTIWSIEFEPQGHEGFRFKAGQFAWITLGDTPYKLQQHPFTVSSSADSIDKIRFTIKELGDFTSKTGQIEPGSTAFIEGPYGNFTLSESTATHNIFIVGGIGITPMMSILETLKDRGDRRKITAIYGAPSKELTPFYEDLKLLSAELNLDVVFVLEDADDDWDGETGYITEEILKNYTPEDYKNCEYFICGPPPMMDVVEPIIAGWGVPVHKVHSERFNIV